MTYSDLRKGRYSAIGQVYHITTVTRNRNPYFCSLNNGRKLVKEMMLLQSKDVAETLCYVIMPDHLHWLMVLRQGKLSEVMKQLKGRSSVAMGEPVWQANYFDHAVRKEEDLRNMARYIIANPLRAKLVERLEEYSLWDAVWLNETLDG
jgi:putative transposase